MPWFTTLKPGETLIINGARLQSQSKCDLAILDDTQVSKLDRNGDLIKGPKPQEANQ